MDTIRSAPKTSRELAYEKYLQTPEWRIRRNRTLSDAGYTCQRCGVQRQLQVHHKTYDRLGAELPEDLEVLCRGCHEGHHYEETQEFIDIYTRILSEVEAESRFTDTASIIEEAKQRTAQRNIPYDADRFNAAIARVIQRFRFVPPTQDAALYEVAEDNEPISRAEARGILSQWGAAHLMKHIPEVKPMNLRQRECKRALSIVMQGIVEQVKRCDEAERAVEPKPEDA